MNATAKIDISKLDSARPEMTAEMMEATGLDMQMIHDVVHQFYTKVRSDAMLGPIFEAHIDDWGPHLEKMVAFWGSVALMTGRYHGRPVPAHTPLPVGVAHFQRWLQLFGETAQELCPPEGAAFLIERAERIAQSLHMAVQNAAEQASCAVPSLR
jgi:hemoglobin